MASPGLIYVSCKALWTVNQRTPGPTADQSLNLV